MISTNFSCVAVALAAGLLATPSSPALAQQVRSDYTQASEKACKVFDKNKPKEEMPWSESSCPGRAGYVVRIFDSDLRMTVSVGRTLAQAGKEPAASEGFGPFNRARETIEWRSVQGKSYAIIQRWMLSDSENVSKDGRPAEVGLLVVTRLPPGAVCRVAYIDVAANPDANTVARKAADEKARAFRCGTDEAQVIGNRGRAAELAKPANP